MVARLSLILLSSLTLSGCAMPRYRLEMAYARDRADAPPLETARDQCRYEVLKHAAHAHAGGASEVETRYAGLLTSACMRARGYRTTERRVVQVRE